jgi:hypothetical protein
MYRGVPTIWACPVNSVLSVKLCPRALAMPKSITLTTGVESCRLTRTLLGFRSRWMTPFWWTCWTAWQTGTNSSRRCRGVRWFWSQNSVIGTPFASSITKYGRPDGVTPPSWTLAMWGGP